MRFIRTKDLQFEETDDIDGLKYGIFSHTWITGQEISFNELHSDEYQEKLGYKKIKEFCELARKTYGLDLVWVDTVCIDKSNNTELFRSINCML